MNRIIFPHLLAITMVSVLIVNFTSCGKSDPDSAPPTDNVSKGSDSQNTGSNNSGESQEAGNNSENPENPQNPQNESIDASLIPGCWRYTYNQDYDNMVLGQDGTYTSENRYNGYSSSWSGSWELDAQNKMLILTYDYYGPMRKERKIDRLTSDVLELDEEIYVRVDDENPITPPDPKEAYAVMDRNSKTVTFYYDEKKSSRTGSIYTIKEEYTSRPEWYYMNKVIIDPSFTNYRPVSTAYWFCRDSENDSPFSISGIEYLNTSNVTNMQRMFHGCCSLKTIDLSHFNTTKVVNMSGMFNWCTSLEAIDLSHFNTRNVTDMSFMFSYCKSITNLDLSSFNTSNVTNMLSMFLSCLALTNLDVSSFNTRYVTNMVNMFHSCKSLTTLDLSSFDTSSVNDIYYMFGYCVNLKTIYASNNWDTSSLSRKIPETTGRMFIDCTNLEGGRGTKWSEERKGYTYARIDGGTDAPGYFTEK